MHIASHQPVKIALHCICGVPEKATPIRNGNFKAMFRRHACISGVEPKQPKQNPSRAQAAPHSHIHTFAHSHRHVHVLETQQRTSIDRHKIYIESNLQRGCAIPHKSQRRSCLSRIPKPLSKKRASQIIYHLRPHFQNHPSRGHYCPAS